MRQARLRSWIGIAVATFGALGLGVAYAQDGATSDASSSQEGASIEVQQPANLTGAEQIAEAERQLDIGSQIGRRVTVMLDEARRERDVVKTNCLNDKLTQIDANLTTAQERLAALQEAVQSNDTMRSNHEYTVMTVLGQKFSTLEQEANQCVGQDIFETGATRIVTTVDPEAPTEDPTQLPADPNQPVPWMPPPASSPGM